MNRVVIGKFPVLDTAGQEALNGICGNLEFSGKNVKKVVMTSVLPGAGKSYMTMHMSATLGRRGKKVVVIDADLRRSTLKKKYGITTESVPMYGLAHWLAGQVPLDNVLYQTNFQGVDMIPVGRIIADPVPLIHSDDFEDLLNELVKYYDYVIVDAPPIGLVFDAADIAQFCDGCIMVTEYNQTRRKELLECTKQMEASGCRVLGYIINKVSFDSFIAKRYYGRSYYSYYGYGSEPSNEKNSKKNRKRDRIAEKPKT